MKLFLIIFTGYVLFGFNIHCGSSKKKVEQIQEQSIKKDAEELFDDLEEKKKENKQSQN